VIKNIGLRGAGSEGAANVIGKLLTSKQRTIRLSNCLLFVDHYINPLPLARGSVKRNRFDFPLNKIYFAPHF
jgi:hypothetical protein